MRRWLRRAAIVTGAIAAIAFAWLLLVSCGCGGNTILTTARFSELRQDPGALRQFLARMPKGGDLHVHLSGAVYAEDFIVWAAAAKLCVQKTDFKIVLPEKMMPADAPTQCDAAKTRPIAAAIDDQPFYDGIVNALSMRNYLPSQSEPSGHDQFFVTFGKYGAISGLVPAEMTAMLLRRYAAEHVQHTEVMLTLMPWDTDLPEGWPKKLRDVTDAVNKTSDPAARLELLGDYLKIAIPIAKQKLDDWESKVRDQLKCGSGNADAGCKVSYRYIAQVTRVTPEAWVFVQTAFAAALVRADSRVAGLNFVGPEDYRVARDDYRKHMRTIAFLTGKDENGVAVPVALHAGELWIGLVPPNDLAFHIREAVDVAGARRIGHGVSLAFERRSDEVLAQMRKNDVAVEVNLTSNDRILGVRGKDHPLPAYREARVPLVLSTDDAGVSRIDLTNEYVRAARDYELSYRTLKRMARNSLVYSFLPDKDKREALERFDKSATEFERAVADERSVFGNMKSIIRRVFMGP